jgi:hypothetical protein
VLFQLAESSLIIVAKIIILAALINTVKITNPDIAMPSKRLPRNDFESPQPDAWKVLSHVAKLFRQGGWAVEEQASEDADRRADLLVRHGTAAYAVELKVSSEGRADRLVPLWAQAFLEAKRAAPPGWQPLAIVAAPSVSERVLRQIVDFARRSAPDAAFGIIDRHGLRYFEGEALAALSEQPERKPATSRPGARRASLFTDVNQWLLKVLLAPWVPPHLTRAPRGEYRNATELARAGGISIMSSFRLIEALRAEGYLDERKDTLRVVRRRDLLDRWRAWAASQAINEWPAVFVLPSDPRADLRAILSQDKVGACLALFAAAEALGLGFVRGVPPHVYLPRLTRQSVGHLPGVALAKGRDEAHLLLREVPTNRSVFHSAVETSYGLTTDVLQTWLDVSTHPTRGREQADLIERRVLGPLLEDE